MLYNNGLALVLGIGDCLNEIIQMRLSANRIQMLCFVSEGSTGDSQASQS